MELEERYVGSLLGLAVGDALGAPLEFMTESQVQIKHGTVDSMIGGGWLGLRPGEFTEETALVLELAESLVEKERLDEADVARRYADWFRSAPMEPSGMLRTSLALLTEGVAVEEVGERARALTGGDAADNGALVRSAPLALLHGSRREGLIESARREAGITHRDSRAAGGAAAFSVVLSFLLEGMAPLEAFDAAFDVLEENGVGVPNVLTDVPAMAPRDLRPTSFVIDSLEVGLYFFLRGKSFEDILVRTVNLGGDADCTGALAGALAGARFGVDGIPMRWLRALPDRSRIRNLAKELLRLRRASD